MQGTAGPAAQDSISYRPDIDGLRAVAVLLVVIFHFHLFSKGSSGFVGVDVFFVISGYLITAIVRWQCETQTFSLLGFWAKRLRRLAPALFVVLAVVMAYGALRMLQSDFEQLAREVVATQFYYANIYFWKNVSYFGLQAGSIYLLHTWSLSVEEQFYILYPLLLALAFRFGRPHLFWVVLAGTIASFALNIGFVRIKPEATFYLMPTRAWELLIGALLTWVPRVRHVGLAHLLGLAGSVLVVIALAAYTDDIYFPGTFALLPTLGAACLIVAGSAPGAWSTRVLSTTPMVAIGRISYSLYLVHWPVNVFASRELAEGYTVGWRWAMVGLCFVLAALLYRWVETPFRRGTLLPKGRALVLGYGAGLAVTVAVCMLVITTHGLPQRVPPEVVRMANFTNDVPNHQRCAEFRFPNETGAQPMCALGARDRPQEWLIWGDSHAFAAQDAFDQWLKERGQAGRLAFATACPPVRGVYIYKTGPSCHELNELMLATAAKDPQVKKIFLVSTWRQASEGRLTTASENLLSVTESVALFHRQFDTTVRELRALGKEVYLWEPLPGARDNVPRRMATALWHGGAPELDFSVAEYRQQSDVFFQALQRNKANVTRTFATSQVLCQSGTCASAIDGQPVYTDNSHLVNSGSPRWARALAAQLNEPPPAAAGRPLP